MRLGYSITSFFGADVSPAGAATAVLDRVETAAAAGYDYVETGDHHAVGGGGYLQSVPTAARLTEHVDHVAVMLLLPLYHPVSVAEQVGTVAALADEVDVWLAVGGGADQFGAFEVPLAERGRRLVEGVALLRRLWAEDDVTFDGEFWSVEGVSVNPKADARLCLGGSAEVAVRRAGHRGDAWVANADASNAFVEEALGWFEAEGGGDVIVRRDVLALADGDRADRLARERLGDGYRGWPADADWVLSGDAASVADDLAALRDLGADEVVVRPMVDRHAHETLEVVAEARDSL